MACRSGSLSRSFLSAVRSSTLRSSHNHFHQSANSSRRLLYTVLPRNVGVIGCVQSLLPPHSVLAATRLTSHISMDARSFCELSEGTFSSRTCPDR